MLLVIALTIVASLLLISFRAVKGPTLFDRILAANSFGTNLIIFIVLLGYMTDTSFFIDVAIIYALINFISTVAILRYFKYGK